MKRTDGRKLSPAAQKERRRIAIRMREQGHKHKVIAEAVDVNPRTLSEWFARLKRYGKEAAIAGGRRGVKEGDGRSLTTEQEQRIQQLLRNNMPEELCLPDALWTRRSVIALVRSRCHVTLPLTTMGLYLRRWGFSPEKPAKQSYERQPKAVQQWLDEHILQYKHVLSRKILRYIGVMRQVFATNVSMVAVMHLLVRLQSKSCRASSLVSI